MGSSPRYRSSKDVGCLQKPPVSGRDQRKWESCAIFHLPKMEELRIGYKLEGSTHSEGPRKEEALTKFWSDWSQKDLSEIPGAKSGCPIMGVNGEGKLAVSAILKYL